MKNFSWLVQADKLSFHPRVTQVFVEEQIYWYLLKIDSVRHWLVRLGVIHRKWSDFSSPQS